MASKIKIKRSGVAGNPTTLAQGELAYSWYSGSGGNKLYIGTGNETGGDAANHTVIGGQYYTGLVDASTAGTLTTNASSIPILDSSGKIDTWKVGNLQLTSNTVSSTNTNGNISLSPNGTGAVQISGAYTLPTTPTPPTTCNEPVIFDVDGFVLEILIFPFVETKPLADILNKGLLATPPLQSVIPSEVPTEILPIPDT